MELASRVRVGRTAALVFGAAAILASIFHELRTGAFTSIGPEVLVAHAVFALLVVIFAIGLSGWYLPPTGYFETFAVPVILPLISAMLAGLVYAATLQLIGNPGVVKLSETFGFGIYASFLFLYVAWPVLLPAMVLASLFLRRRFSHTLVQQ